MDYLQLIPEEGITLEEAILRYHKEKSWWRKLFHFDAPAIRALKETDFNNRDALVKILGRFVEHTPDTPLTFNLVSHALVQHLFCDPTTNKKLAKNEISLIIQALTSLYKGELLTLENFDAIKAHSKPEALAKALSILMVNKILTTENLNSPIYKALKTHCEPADFANAMVILWKAKILSGRKFNNKSVNTMNTTIDAVKGHARPEALAKALTILKEAKLLGDKSTVLLKGHARPEALAKALIILEEAKLKFLDQEDFEVTSNILKTYPHPLRFANAFNDHPNELANTLRMLNNKGIIILTGNFDAILNALKECSNSADLVSVQSVGQSILKGANISLTKDGSDVIKEQSDSVTFVNALSILGSVGLLTQANFDLIKEQSDPVTLANVLSILKDPALLTQANFDVIKGDANLVRFFNLKDYISPNTFIFFYEGRKEKFINSSGIPEAGQKNNQVSDLLPTNSNPSQRK